ncbi:hypothetical protein QQF64_015441 [Cirrhinus molitorella]|uniref:Uncharacterized protein n=1 Tax=Cirrhinus molitorella TaxID=172907 RepID=A0ABR3NUZ3_9TELE
MREELRESSAGRFLTVNEAAPNGGREKHRQGRERPESGPLECRECHTLTYAHPAHPSSTLKPIVLSRPREVKKLSEALTGRKDTHIHTH